MSKYAVSIIRGNGQTVARTIDELKAGKPTVLDHVTIERSRPSPIDAYDPATATFTIAHNLDDPETIFKLGDRVAVEITPEGSGDPHKIFHGYIDRIYTPAKGKGEKYRRTTFTAIDEKGIAARTYVGAPPWKYEPYRDRLERFSTLYPRISLEAQCNAIASDAYHFDNTTGTVVPEGAPKLDIDSTSALELFEKSAAATGDQISAGEWKLWIKKKPVPRVVLYKRGNSVYRKLENSPQVPSSMIEDIGQEISYSSRIAAISASWTAVGWTSTREVTRNWGDINSVGQRLTIDAHAAVSLPVPDEQLNSRPVEALPVPVRIQQLVDSARASGKPEPALDALRLRRSLNPERFDYIAEVMGVDGGRDSEWDSAIEVTGPAPYIKNRYQAVMGIRYELSANPRESTLTLSVAPLALMAAGGMVWAQLRAGIPSLMFYELNSVTFADMAQIVTTSTQG
ncbi:hypothetical protein [Dermabacter jinjuensis]|uniref:Uncharacterized protein n=1 Tax=Dermabacter jinjuensis TaxID=1667168 RepID=A0ABN5DLA8_9MICO|nr:hypothetical protein [Dermabacter jinjuensis]ATH95866.1 hypothetical protein COP05_01235 [Dermabacter jinjuensis]UEB89925.1 hypothetical protein LK448_10705 [Dermabacter jinjuensis]